MEELNKELDKMKLVYVAGAMNAGDICSMLGNISRGIKVGAELLKAGYAVYVPHMDIGFKLQGGDDFDIPMDMYYLYTLKIMKRCDAVVVCPKSADSMGTNREINVALESGIPVFYSVKEFLRYKF